MPLFGKRGIGVLQYIRQKTFGRLDRQVSHVDGDASHLELLRPPACFCVSGETRLSSSPGLLDAVPAFFARWRFSLEDMEIDVGGAIGISPGDRPCEGNRSHLWVDAVVWRDPLRQGMSPVARFIGHRLPSFPLLRVYNRRANQTSAEQRIYVAALEEVKMLEQEELPRQVLLDPHLRKGGQIQNKLGKVTSDMSMSTLISHTLA